MSLREDSVQVISGALREGPKQDFAAHTSLRKLDSSHLDTFTRATCNLLSTDLAIITYAQLIDGLPTEEVA